MSMEFQAWPKTPRLRKAGSTTITEKIDGTNACVVIEPVGHDSFVVGRVARVPHDDVLVRALNGEYYLVGAQSRKRMITPESDNAGFARWVWDNVRTLVELLGPGRHFGEWWGQGIQRRYGMDRKVFSLFNANRWGQAGPDWDVDAMQINMDVVPVLYRGVFSDFAINESLSRLAAEGSIAAARWGAPKPQKAEGIVLRHADLGGNLKVMLENDDIPKTLQ